VLQRAVFTEGLSEVDKAAAAAAIAAAAIVLAAAATVVVGSWRRRRLEFRQRRQRPLGGVAGAVSAGVISSY
jgi:hypothetical protein